MLNDTNCNTVDVNGLGQRYGLTVKTYVFAKPTYVSFTWSQRFPLIITVVPEEKQKRS